MNYDPGVGATPDLSLRISVATLVRVIFKHPLNSEWVLALERKATLHETKVEVKSQPFGGAVRILDLNPIRNVIGDFHFDTERSRSEQDFRLFIRPSAWSMLREFCIQHVLRDDDPILETNPRRELAEEFTDTLKIELRPEQYTCKPVTTLIENEAAPTENIDARGIPTVRVYRIFEAFITDSGLAHVIQKNSENLSDQNLSQLALEDFQNDRKGRANTVLALPLKRITDYYLDISLEERNSPVAFEMHQLDETVSAILEGVVAPKYQVV